MGPNGNSCVRELDRCWNSSRDGWIDLLGDLFLMGPFLLSKFVTV